MKAKLIKTGNDYLLKEYGYGETLAITSGTMEGRKLSLKNCQAIELGYDLDELSSYWRWYYSDIVPEYLRDHLKNSYEAGFYKALKILGDKKFSEEDVMLGWDAGIMSKSIVDNNWTSLIRSKKLLEHRESYQRDLKPSSLQQTEWDVEIEMICPHPNDTYVCGIQYGCDEEGCNHPNQIPLLDSDGCLILKLTQ